MHKYRDNKKFKNSFSCLEPTDLQCQLDGDCPSKLGCFNGVCKDPCIETKPCITGARCSVVDTLPMRTMICECLPNFAGDATVACIPGERRIHLMTTKCLNFLVITIHQYSCLQWINNLTQSAASIPTAHQTWPV